MKTIKYIFIFIIASVSITCSGSKKYFKAAERLEKQGLVNDAANYYLESLQRRPTFVEARIKLKDVGQKLLNNLASDFFRNFNTQQLEASLTSFEKLKEFYLKAEALNVTLDYPKSYDDDYKKAVENYCDKNYLITTNLVYEKKYTEAIPFINKVKKYNSSYKNLQQLDVIAVCEPLYQKAIINLENKNYSNALLNLNEIKLKSDNYKDAADLYELAAGQESKTYLLFEPNNSNDRSEKELEEYLYNNFSQLGLNSSDKLKLLNNTPFQNANKNIDLYNGSNLDLLQAIRKASGTDYYYVFDVVNRREYNSGLQKTQNKAFREIKTRINDSTVVTEYKPLEYNLVKAQRSFSYDFKYKIMNSQNGQVIGSQFQTIRGQDAVEYQEFLRPFDGNVNNLFPYNPQTTSSVMQFNPRNWRSLFSARSNLKSMEDIKNEALNQNLSVFRNSLKVMK